MNEEVASQRRGGRKEKGEGFYHVGIVGDVRFEFRICFEFRI